MFFWYHSIQFSRLRYVHYYKKLIKKFQVAFLAQSSSNPDIYRLPVGIRSIKWTSTSFLINKKSVYFRGFGRHEDSIIRGKGLDLVTVARDHELLKWVGANAYRTSHYPYSDEVLDIADKYVKNVSFKLKIIY